MKTVIGWTFLLLSPFFLGAFILIAIGNVMGLAPADFMPTAFPSYTIAWILFYVSWFDGSKYQKNL